MMQRLLISFDGFYRQSQFPFLFQPAIENGAHNGACLVNLRIRKAIKDSSPFTPGFDDSSVEEQRHVLGKTPFADIQSGDQIRCRSFTFIEAVYDLQPDRVPERFADFTLHFEYFPGQRLVVA